MDVSHHVPKLIIHAGPLALLFDRSGNLDYLMETIFDCRNEDANESYKIDHSYFANDLESMACLTATTISMIRTYVMYVAAFLNRHHTNFLTWYEEAEDKFYRNSKTRKPMESTFPMRMKERKNSKK